MSTIIIRTGLVSLILLVVLFFIKAQEWNNLSKLYEKFYDQNKYEEALAVVQKQLRIAEGMLFLRRFYLPFSLNNLGTIYYAQNKFSEAESSYLKAVALAESAFGSVNPRLLTLFENLLKVYETVGDKEKAQILLDKINSIKTRGR